MKTLSNPVQVQELLQALLGRKVPVRVHPPRRAAVVATVRSLSSTGFLTLETSGPAPPRGVYVQVTGIRNGAAFGFVAEFLRTDADGGWMITAPSRIELRQRRTALRMRPTFEMSLRVSVGGRFVEADLFDLSEGGLAFSTREFPAPAVAGMLLSGRLDLPRNRTIPVDLEVRHVQGLKCGARFVNIPRAAMLELRNLATREERTGDLPEISLGT
ncbi:MAG: PilZ domain-containing protein [Proteobacteria bacterium]|nr:PilZ domain-containing protein [Pseudomonadota bacterium]MCP4918391.1 PilZ domain-containing protein [Pseudomonadota bacterium]